MSTPRLAPAPLPAVVLVARDAPGAEDATLAKLREELGQGIVQVRSLDEAPAEGLLLLWVGRFWERGLAEAAAAPPEVHRRVLLAGGPRQPATTPGMTEGELFGVRVREAGLLSWWAPPFPGWVLAAARAALGRAVDLADRVEAGLAALETPPGTSLQPFLLHQLACLKATLGADLALLAEARPPGEPVARLYDAVRRVDGLPRRGAFEHVTATGPRPIDDTVAVALAPGRRGAPLHLPDLQSQGLVPKPLGPAHRSVLTLPVPADPSLPEGPPPGALLLYWEAPRLLHPREWAYVTRLGEHIARELRHRTEALRMERRHRESMAALQEPGTGAAADPEAAQRERVARLLTPLGESDLGLEAAAVLLPLHSRATAEGPGWIQMPRPGGLERDWDALLAEAHEGEGAELRPRADGTVLTRTRLDAGRACLAVPESDRAELQQVAPELHGWLVCLWRDRDHARDARGLVRDMSHDLWNVTGRLRAERDGRSLAALSRALADSRDPWPILVEMGRVIAACLDADGVKFDVVVSHEGRAVVEQLYWTGQAHPQERPWREPVADGDPGTGLTARVLHRGTPLFVRHARGPDRDPVHCRCWSPGGGPHLATGVFSREAVRAAEEGRAADRRDQEHVQLLLPLQAERRGIDEVVGVLGVWRTTPEPFDRVFDLASLQTFGPHVAAACRQVLARRAQLAAETAIQGLAEGLRPQTPLGEAVDAALAAAGRVRGAAATLLLRTDGDRGHLLVQGTWSQGDDIPAATLRERLAPGWFAADPADPTGPLVQHLARTAPGWEVVFTGALKGQDRAPWGHLLCLQDRRAGSLRAHLGEEAQRAATRTFAQTAAQLLRHHVQARVEGFLGELGRSTTAARLTMEALVEHTVEALARELGHPRDRVVVGYAVASTHQRPAHVAPPSAAGLAAVEIQSTSLTAALLRRAAPGAVRLLDLDQGPGDDLDRPQLQATLEALGWAGLGSWLCAPLAHDGRSLGALKVLSRAGAPVPLGPDEQLLVERTAAWAAEVGDGLLRTELRDQFADLARELTHAWGERLVQVLSRGLDAWVERAARPGAHVAVVARSRVRDMVFLSARTRGLANDTMDLLKLLSARLGDDEQTWTVNEVVSVYGPYGPDRRRLPLAGVAVPLGVSGMANLSGHMLLLDREPILPRERRMLREAARDVSIVLLGELLRREWNMQSGIFRHAMRAPVQGLSSVTTEAVLALEDVGQAAEARRLEREAARHEESIRLWGDTHKYFVLAQSPERLNPAPETLSLYEEVERCARRYAAHLEDKEQTLLWAWPVPPAQGPRVRLDPRLFDILVSNLLENACKYGKEGRAITVGCELFRGTGKCRLYVENIGRRIPDERAEAIYKPGVRSVEHKEAGAVTGEGIGLYVCRAIAEAHRGSLNHTCQADPHSTRKDGPRPGDPHAVRFTFQFPHRS